MRAPEASTIVIAVSDTLHVSGLLSTPPSCRIGLVLAHGAGAGMHHPAMSGLADGLYQRGIATLRYQFPFMERQAKRTDPPAVCHATVRAAVRCACRLMDDLPLVAGGRSFGGRMTSQAQALSPLPEVRGLAFFGFPLHPAKKPANTRAAHLDQVSIPMLFLQGTRDHLTELSLLRPVIERVQPLATLEVLDHADHSFNVLVRSGRTMREVQGQVLDSFVSWATTITRSDNSSTSN